MRTHAERQEIKKRIQQIRADIEELCEIPQNENDCEAAIVVRSELISELKSRIQEREPDTPLEKIEIKPDHITQAMKAILGKDKLKPIPQGNARKRETVRYVYRGLRFKARLSVSARTGSIPDSIDLDGKFDCLAKGHEFAMNLPRRVLTREENEPKLFSSKKRPI